MSGVDLVSTVARLEALFAQGVSVIKHLKKRSSPSKTILSSTKLEEFQDLYVLQNLIRTSSKAELDPFYAQLRTLIIKKCVPVSGVLGLRDLVASCLVALLQAGKKLNLFDSFRELVSSCEKSTKNMDEQLAGLRCLRELAFSFPEDLASSFLVAFPVISKNLKADENCIREEAVICLRAFLRTLEKKRSAIGNLACDVPVEIVKSLNKIWSDRGSSAKIVAMEVLALVASLFGEKESIDSSIQTCVDGLKDDSFFSRYFFGKCLGKLLAISITSSPVTMKPSTNTLLAGAPWKGKLNYEASDVKSALKILTKLLPSLPKRLTLGLRTSLSAPPGTPVPSDLENRNKVQFEFNVAAALITFIQTVGTKNILVLSRDAAASNVYEGKGAEEDDPDEKGVSSASRLVSTIEQFLIFDDDASNPKYSFSRSSRASTMSYHVLYTGFFLNSDDSLYEVILNQVWTFLTDVSASSHSTFGRIAGSLSFLAKIVSHFGEESLSSWRSKVTPAWIQPFICSSSFDVRISSVSLLMALSKSSPLFASSILYSLHMSTALHISEATAPAIPLEERFKNLCSLHGFTQGVSGLLHVISSSPCKIPWVFVGDLFSMSKMMLSIYKESRQELKLGLPVESVKTICESGWTIFDSVLRLESIWTAQNLAAILSVWKEFLGPKLGFVIMKDVNDVHIELHCRTLALATISTFSNLWKAHISKGHGVIKPICVFLANSINFVLGLQKTSIWTQHCQHDESLQTQLQSFLTNLFEAHLVIHPSNYQSRHVALLLLISSRLSVKKTEKNSVLESRSDSPHSAQFFVKGDPLLFEPWDLPLIGSPQQSSSAFRVSSNTVHSWDSLEGSFSPEKRSINGAILLLQSLLPHISLSHQTQILNYFLRLARQFESLGDKFEDCLYNVATAFSFCLENLPLNEDKSSSKDRISVGVTLGFQLLKSKNHLIQFCGADSLGLICSNFGDSLVQDVLKKCKDNFAQDDPNDIRAFCLLLASLHQRLGAVSSQKYLSYTMSVLAALSETSDHSSRPWICYSTTVLVGVMGLSFRSFFDQAISIIAKTLLEDIDLHSRDSQTLFLIHVADAMKVMMDCFGPEIISKPSMASLCIPIFDHLVVSEVHPVVRSKLKSILLKISEDILMCLGNPDSPLFKHVVKYVRETFHSDMLIQQLDSDGLAIFSRILLLFCSKQWISAFGSDTDLRLFQIMNLPCIVDSSISSKNLSSCIHQQIERCSVENLTKWFLISRDLAIQGKFPNSILETAEAPEWLSVSYNTKKAASRALLLLLESVKLHANSIHTTSAPLPVSKKAIDKPSTPLVHHLRDLVKLVCRFSSSLDAEIQCLGLQCLQLTFRLFDSVPDPAEPAKKFVEFFQSEVTAAVRSAFSSESSLQVRETACQVISEIVLPSSFSDELSFKRALSVLFKPIELGFEAVPGWQDALDSSSRTILLLRHFSAISRMVVSCSNITDSVSHCHSWVLDLFKENDFVFNRLEKLVDDFWILLNASLPALRTIKGNFFNGCEANNFSDYVIATAENVLRASSILISTPSLKKFITDSFKMKLFALSSVLLSFESSQHSMFGLESFECVLSSSLVSISSFPTVKSDLIQNLSSDALKVLVNNFCAILQSHESNPVISRLTVRALSQYLSKYEEHNEVFLGTIRFCLLQIGDLIKNTSLNNVSDLEGLVNSFFTFLLSQDSHWDSLRSIIYDSMFALISLLDDYTPRHCYGHLVVWITKFLVSLKQEESLDIQHVVSCLIHHMSHMITFADASDFKLVCKSLILLDIAFDQFHSFSSLTSSIRTCNSKLFTQDGDHTAEILEIFALAVESCSQGSKFAWFLVYAIIPLYVNKMTISFDNRFIESAQPMFSQLLAKISDQQEKDKVFNMFAQIWLSMELNDSKKADHRGFSCLLQFASQYPEMFKNFLQNLDVATQERLKQGLLEAHTTAKSQLDTKSESLPGSDSKKKKKVKLVSDLTVPVKSTTLPDENLVEGFGEPVAFDSVEEFSDFAEFKETDFHFNSPVSLTAQAEIAFEDQDEFGEFQ